ncbi:uncharacterized protein PRCAT00003846001 [Priceomyces carsonii]|uniref:uncharacterized protein n=1 Tax=Priceomyces carsonii TaxID=28549 RepID=UPI002EDB8D27|nr:unnamed protein product [Priceomyces carsonii]
MTSWTSVWKPIFVNRSNRPILGENEHNVFIRDHVGLYQGKQKITNRQNGRVYLTNKRVIYLDNERTENSMGLDINDIKYSTLIDRFLKSSPKVKLFIREDLKNSLQQNIEDQPAVADWVCMICSFNNHISVNADVDKEIPPCVSCGIRPSKALILKAILKKTETQALPKVDNQCPKCTFMNHPSLSYCEMCGTKLISAVPEALHQRLYQKDSNRDLQALQTNNNLNISLQGDVESYTDEKPYIKLSFRKGGEVEFYNHMKDVIEELKWQRLTQKGSVNQNGIKVDKSEPEPQRIKGGGIHGLEQIGEQKRRQNEIILSSSLDDLEQLMYKYLDLLNLSSSFSKLVNRKSLNVDLIQPFNVKKSSNIYYKELSRHISEYLTNYELTKNSSMITSQDLFANINRFLVLTLGFGSELITPDDFNKAIELFEPLGLPIVVTRYEKSGLVVLCLKTDMDYSLFIVKHLKELEESFKYNKLKVEILLQQDDDNYLKEEFNYFKGDTISGISGALNWSYSITVEEIESCVASGSIVVDHNIQGTFYFINRFGEDYEDNEDDDENLRAEIKSNLMEEQRAITQKLKTQHAINNQLIDLTPNYDFGIVQPNDVPLHTVSLQSSASVSLNDLKGLQL